MKTFTSTAILTFVFCLFFGFSFTQAQVIGGVDDDDAFYWWYDNDVSVEGSLNSDIPESLVFKAFPNPASGDILNISFVNLTEESFVELYDENGKSVYIDRIGDEISNTGTLRLNTSTFASGMYLVKLVTNNYQLIEKVIIR